MRKLFLQDRLITYCVGKETLLDVHFTLKITELVKPREHEQYQSLRFLSVDMYSTRSYFLLPSFSTVFGKMKNLKGHHDSTECHFQEEQNDINKTIVYSKIQ